MSTFDQKAYEENVLRPLRGSLGRDLPDDLVARYAVEPGMDDAATRSRIEAVVRLWNKHALRGGHGGTVAQNLIRAHDSLQAEKGPALFTAAFWRNQDAEREKRVGGAITEVTEQLRSFYGPLGLLTATQLKQVAAGHTALADADVARACRDAGLRVVEPVELPASVPAGVNMANLQDALGKAGARTVAELIDPQMTAFGVLGGLTVSTANGSRGIDRAAVVAFAGELEKLPDSPAVRGRREAAGLLVTAVGAGADPGRIALFALLEPVRANGAGGAPPPQVLLRMLTATRLVPQEAALIAVSVLAESGGPSRDPARLVGELLADGRLVAAEQTAAALGGEPGEEARAKAARQRAAVEDLQARAASELRSGREEEAGKLLRKALALASDLPGLAEEVAAVPVTPVLAVTAGPDGSGVRVSWRPSADHAEGTEYRVVRGAGHAPVDPDDGVLVGAVVGTACADAGPPVGRPVHYAVFARAPGGRWSRPTTGETRVVPPVGDLVVEGGDRVVTGRWTVHPDVTAVEVRRGDGSGGSGDAVAVQRATTFRDTSAADGVRYHYSVVACYRAPDGSTLRADAVVGRGATRLAAKPVTSLQAAPAGGATTAIRLSWQTRPGNAVVVRRADTACPWDYGETVPLERVRAWGRELDGELTERGRSTVLVAPVPPGRSVCVAFTVGVDEAVRGDEKVVDVTDPVRRVQAQRFGDDVRVTWTWPDAVGAAEVVWPGGRRTITTAQYRNEGGCLLRGVPGVRRIEVGALVPGGTGEESRAPAVSVEVDERPSQLGYELRRSGNRLLGGVRCTLTLRSAEPVGSVTVVLIGAPGAVMPLTREAGDELARKTVSLQPGVPQVFEDIPVPSHLRKPYWLRCFLVDPGSALLVDPPVSQMKVS